MTMALPSSTWHGSSGTTGRSNREAVLQLHKLHFVEKRGVDGVNEVVEKRRKERCAQDARAGKERSKQLNASLDRNKALQMQGGSMSARTIEEHARMEGARRDPIEALDRMTKHMIDLQRSYKEQKEAMASRVAQMPAMNVRPTAEWNEIEQRRQDPQEAKEKMTNHMRNLAQTFKNVKTEMVERVAAAPKMTFRSKEQRAQIEEWRQDPQEAEAQMSEHLRGLSKSFKAEKEEMHQRVAESPSMSFRTKEENIALEEARQDPQEALERMTKHMNELGRSYKDNNRRMLNNVAAKPNSTIRGKAERDMIEARRQDPDEAKEKMTQHLKDMARSFKADTKAMHERVHATPVQTFRTENEQIRVEKKLRARMLSQKS